MKSIYRYVDPDNQRALRFYDKNNYRRVPYDAERSTAESRFRSTIGISSRERSGNKQKTIRYFLSSDKCESFREDKKW